MSSILKLEVKSASVSGSFDCDVLAVFQNQTGKSKKAIAPRGHYASIVEQFSKGGAFAGAHGSVSYLRFNGKATAESVLLVGMGAAEELTLEKARIAAGHAWAKLKSEKDKTLRIDLDTLLSAKGLNHELSHFAWVSAFAEGLLLGAYEFTKHKTGKKDSSGPIRIVFVTSEKSLAQQLAKELPRLEAMVEALRVTRDWSNEPSNVGIPEYFANEARKFARQYGLKCKVLNEKDAAREKMGLFLGVGEGAEREGRIVVLEYTPKAAPKRNLKTIALVGKGVTFDSGGISIKPSARMEEMKHDMTGAATVMGAMLLAAKYQVPNRLIAVMAFTENMPDGRAIQPGNVLVSRAGKTVEVVNTDAEGRLILADVLDYVQDMKPDAIIDVATLTGAVGIALGKFCCGIFGNDEALIDAIRRAGAAHGERIWELPAYDDYFEDLKSDTADMRNSGYEGGGGASRGAVFLKQFIRKGNAWAHMDIAATAAGLSYLPYYPKKGASGCYVRALARFAAEF
ncbi:MAG TPA: leucyl aminopeptidase [Bdellovibrionales bacterium]|nr:MAG: hypothetical protein A2Z97_13190 [Bdellovibrionales bacterium GWB1_52_6]OFZ05787.1 MAG: hypothetical protein A2X97_03740 [Bdellovibrionales bacterium GWA1_52_35]OFZ43685.1 MAG: hypothetical protein A2070_02680 [Bdellovibrionales bacterium GWC1_52_8]HAR42201.1 leucyl aminopeptidase [Bdellovibrionales bacterium]HCM40272.1 leucyl aminopeptidase [Bdellovibrionales bacterium]